MQASFGLHFNRIITSYFLYILYASQLLLEIAYFDRAIAISRGSQRSLDHVHPVFLDESSAHSPGVRGVDGVVGVAIIGRDHVSVVELDVHVTSICVGAGKYALCFDLVMIGSRYPSE